MGLGSIQVLMTRRLVLYREPQLLRKSGSVVNKLGPIWWVRRGRRVSKPPALNRALWRAWKQAKWNGLFDPSIPF